MSRFDELIAEFCPDGVEYRRLGDVANIKRGTRVVKKNLSASEGYPVFQNSLAPLGYHTDFNEPAGTPFIICAGAAGEIGYSESEYWAADDCYSIECSEALDSKYALHSLLHSQGTLKAQVRKASIPRLSKDVVTRLEIPVPAIEVQHEIARILDAFAELTTELTTELTCRKQQYAYYRDRLLSRESLEAMDGKPVEMMRLGDVAMIKTGSKPSEILESGPFSYVNAGTTPSGFVESANTEEDTVTTPSRGQGGIGFVGYQSYPFWCGPLCYRIKAKTDELLNKYLAYYLSSRADLIRNCMKEGGTPAVNRSDLLLIEIPIPSLATQRKVVDILDRFDALTTSLTDGIPAEIEARRQQYEYYRDRLLDLPRKDADAA